MTKVRGVLGAEFVMLTVKLTFILVFLMGLPTSPLWAQGGDGRNTRQEIETSYIYSVVLGSGVYSSHGERLVVLNLPFEVQLTEPTDELDPYWVYETVAQIGYRSVGSEDLSQWIPESISTLSVFPSIEYVYPLNEDMRLRPKLQVSWYHF